MAPNTHNNIYYGPGRYSKRFNPFNPHENSVRYYYCPFCFPDAETEMKRLGNLLKVVASRWLCQVPPKCSDPWVHSLQALHWRCTISYPLWKSWWYCKQLLTDKCLQLVLRGVKAVELIWFKLLKRWMLRIYDRVRKNKR